MKSNSWLQIHVSGESADADQPPRFRHVADAFCALLAFMRTGSPQGSSYGGLRACFAPFCAPLVKPYLHSHPKLHTRLD